jgi:hypothetical protein
MVSYLIFKALCDLMERYLMTYSITHIIKINTAKFNYMCYRYSANGPLAHRVRRGARVYYHRYDHQHDPCRLSILREIGRCSAAEGK